MIGLVDTARDIGVVAGAIVAVGTAITLLVAKVVRPMWRIWLETVERTKRLLEIAESELLPNHGSSMKDRLDETDARSEQMEERLAGLDHVARHHMDRSGEILFDLSNTLGDVSRQLEQHIADADVHMRRTVYSPEQRDAVRRMQAQRQQHVDEEGPGANDDS